MSHGVALMIESMVAVLLLCTIGYCVLLNGRLRRLKADEQALKATISELITATEIAERAIAGLKLTVRECDQNLGERLRMAERFSETLREQLENGGEILARLTQIALAARSASAEAPPEAAHPDSRATLLAAQAFAERARSRVKDIAA